MEYLVIKKCFDPLSKSYKLPGDKVEVADEQLIGYLPYIKVEPKKQEVKEIETVPEEKKKAKK